MITIEERAKVKAKEWADKAIGWVVEKDLIQFAQEQETITRNDIIDKACHEFDSFVDDVMSKHSDLTFCAAAKSRFRKSLLREN